MDKYDEYRRNADEARRQADAAKYDDDRANWLRIAQGWMGLLKGRKATAADTFEADSAAKGTGQKDSESSH